MANKKIHENLIGNMIKVLETGKRTRDDLVSILQVPRTTVFENLKVLIREGTVMRENEHDGKRGHPRVFFRLVRSNG